MKKYLVIRFSSIGDLVLCSPVLRCLKKQSDQAEVHVITKRSFGTVVENNPYVDKVFTIEKEIDEVKAALKGEHYDFVVDLHRNLRSFRLKRYLKRPSATFPKLNFQKFLLTNFKWNRMPDIHIVDRYFEAVKPLNIVNDQQGLDFFLSPDEIVNPEDYGLPQQYIAFAIGAQFATKRLPLEQLIAVIKKVEGTVALLGGPTDKEMGEAIHKAASNTVNLCGQLSLQGSASIVQQARKLITHDTGLMHIAAAFNKPTISVWGNTVPELGMYPYQPQQPDNYSIHQVKVSCRPCSKIGHQSCPKKHFNCMTLQDTEAIAAAANKTT